MSIRRLLTALSLFVAGGILALTTVVIFWHPSRGFSIGRAPVPLVAIPSGSFLMGSKVGEDDEKPAHRVTITYGFFIGKTEVTQKEFIAVMRFNPSGNVGDSMPVEAVTWGEALEFCLLLTQRESAAGNLPEGMVYRLPTEAEWEYCCRADSQTAFCFGDDPALLGDYAWFGDNSGNETHPVGEKKPNAWGIFDMHGNVSEWCLDADSDHLPDADATNPLVMDESYTYILRGGSELGDAPMQRSSRRGASHEFDRVPNIGFRVVLGPILEEK